MNPDKIVCKTHCAVRFWAGVPFWFAKVAPWVLRALRVRYSNAAYTTKHPVITIKNAMIRSSFFEIQRRGHKAWCLAEVKAAFRMPLAFVAL
jgi:hypothetical protein